MEKLERTNIKFFKTDRRCPLYNTGEDDNLEDHAIFHFEGDFSCRMPHVKQMIDLHNDDERFIYQSSIVS